MEASVDPAVRPLQVGVRVRVSAHRDVGRSEQVGGAPPEAVGLRP